MLWIAGVFYQFSGLVVGTCWMCYNNFDTVKFDKKRRFQTSEAVGTSLVCISGRYVRLYPQTRIPASKLPTNPGGQASMLQDCDVFSWIRTVSNHWASNVLPQGLFSTIHTCTRFTDFKEYASAIEICLWPDQRA